MRLDDLECFVAVCKCGQLSAAARQLGCTQSALSKAVARLETEFGLRLLERTPRGVSPSDAGLRLRLHAQEVLQGCGDLHAGMSLQRASSSGLLRLGVLPTLVRPLLSPLIARFLPTRPMARFRFETQLSAPLLERLAHGDLDLAMLALPQTLPTGMAQHVLGPIQMCLVARAEHPRLHQFHTLADLVNERWALPSENLFLRQWLDARFVSQGLPPTRVVVESDASPTHFNAILRHSDLLGMAPIGMLREPSGHGLQALCGADFHWPHTLGLVWRRNGLTPLAHEFRDAAIAWYARHLHPKQ